MGTLLFLGLVAWLLSLWIGPVYTILVFIVIYIWNQL